MDEYSIQIPNVFILKNALKIIVCWEVAILAEETNWQTSKFKVYTSAKYCWMAWQSSQTTTGTSFTNRDLLNQRSDSSMNNELDPHKQMISSLLIMH